MFTSDYMRHGEAGVGGHDGKRVTRSGLQALGLSSPPSKANLRSFLLNDLQAVALDKLEKI